MLSRHVDDEGGFRTAQSSSLFPKRGSIPSKEPWGGTPVLKQLLPECCALHLLNGRDLHVAQMICQALPHGASRSCEGEIDRYTFFVPPPMRRVPGNLDATALLAWPMRWVPTAFFAAALAFLGSAFSRWVTTAATTGLARCSRRGARKGWKAVLQTPERGGMGVPICIATPAAVRRSERQGAGSRGRNGGRDLAGGVEAGLHAASREARRRGGGGPGSG